MNQTVVCTDGTITLPEEVRRLAHIDEGDVLEMSVTADGLLLQRRDTSDDDQSWFWSAKWQANEREADDDIARGDVTYFSSAGDFLAALRGLAG
jgi:bifunctional DNA-binding transcriptional regulator/antitoxin component of YhaV-PrlF toxin-antitoxin module